MFLNISFTSGQLCSERKFEWCCYDKGIFFPTFSLKLAMIMLGIFYQARRYKSGRNALFQTRSRFCIPHIFGKNKQDSVKFLIIYIRLYQQHRGPFSNYVTHFWLFFDHPPTYGYVFAPILLINYLSKAFKRYTFADHPPTSTA